MAGWGPKADGQDAQIKERPEVEAKPSPRSPLSGHLGAWGSRPRRYRLRPSPAQSIDLEASTALPLSSLIPPCALQVRLVSSLIPAPDLSTAGPRALLHPALSSPRSALSNPRPYALHAE